MIFHSTENPPMFSCGVLKYLLKAKRWPITMKLCLNGNKLCRVTRIFTTDEWKPSANNPPLKTLESVEANYEYSLVVGWRVCLTCHLPIAMVPKMEFRVGGVIPFFAWVDALQSQYVLRWHLVEFSRRKRQSLVLLLGSLLEPSVFVLRCPVSKKTSAQIHDHVRTHADSYDSRMASPHWIALDPHHYSSPVNVLVSAIGDNTNLAKRSCETSCSSNFLSKILATFLYRAGTL